MRRVALVVVEPARHAEALALRDEDDEAAGERDLRREPRALRLHRVLHRLDEDRLAAADEVLDAAAVAALELGADDLVDVEEAVLLEADLDERGLHPGQHVVDACRDRCSPRSTGARAARGRPRRRDRPRGRRRAAHRRRPTRAARASRPGAARGAAAGGAGLPVAGVPAAATAVSSPPACAPPTCARPACAPRHAPWTRACPRLLRHAPCVREPAQPPVSSVRARRGCRDGASAWWDRLSRPPRSRPALLLRQARRESGVRCGSAAAASDFRRRNQGKKKLLQSCARRRRPATRGGARAAGQ